MVEAEDAWLDFDEITQPVDEFQAICVAFRLPHIQFLQLSHHLGGRQVNILGARLAVLSSLKVLRLRFQNIDNAYAKTLVTGLKQNRSIRQLSFQHCNFEDIHAWKIIVKGLSEMQHPLQALQFLFCNLQWPHLVQLEPFLSSSSPALKCLDLSGNFFISSEAVKTLFSWLGDETCRLQRLYLAAVWCPPMRGVDLFPLFHALSNNSSLKRLSLSCNDLQDADLCALAQVLRSNKSVVTHLDLSNNGTFSWPGMADLSAALAVNTSLTTLDLSHNKLGVDTIDKLAEALRHNTHLRTLYLQGNDGFRTIAGAKALVAAIQESSGLDRVETSRPDPPWSDLYDRELQWYTHLNWGGRRLLQDQDARVPLGLWPLLLARVNQNQQQKYHAHDQRNVPSVLFYLLNRGPVLFERTSAFARVPEDMESVSAP
jgi:Ran GTPase-activating protein (RanGAP) involved in mRNA processing and transport